jgi:large subunit ribosomal protein L10
MSEQKHYPQKKVDQIQEIEVLLKKYPMIGLTNLNGISSNVLQKIRRTLRGDTEIKIAKNTLKRIAFNKVVKTNPKLSKLLDQINGNTAIIFSNKSPFALQKFFNANRVAVSAKPGQKATDDVWVSAGPTDMSPGPVIGELNSVGIRTSVENGKIKINQDVQVLSAGDTITEAHASVFSKLSIKPLKMGIALSLALEENGELLYEKDLNIDVDAILKNVELAHSQAFNLSVATAYPTTSNIGTLIMLGNSAAMNLSVGVGYPTKENIGMLLAKAVGQASAFA